MSIANLKSPGLNSFNLEVNSVTTPTANIGTLLSNSITIPFVCPFTSSNSDISPNGSNSGQQLVYDGNSNINFIIPDSSNITPGWHYKFYATNTTSPLVNVSLSNVSDNYIFPGITLPTGITGPVSALYLGNSTYFLTNQS